MHPVLLIMKGTGNVRVMKQVLGSEGFSVIPVMNPDDLDHALADVAETPVGLVDVAGFGPAVWELCRVLQQEGVRFVALSAAQQNAMGSRALQYGAVNFLQKPVEKAALVQLLRTLGN